MGMTLKDAIQHAMEVANSKCDECGKEHAKLAEWLRELEYYKDPTPITKEWINQKFFFDEERELWDFGEDVYNVEIKCISEELYSYSVFVPDFNYKIKVNTRGELRHFFAACRFPWAKKILS